MSDPSAQLFVDSIRSKIPVWMSRNVGFRFLTSMILLCDLGLEIALQSLYARFPTIGTPSALPLTGSSRGVVRGMFDTDLSFGIRLRRWLDDRRHAGSQEAIARRIQEYTGCKIRVVNRHGHMVTVDTDGTLTTNDISWNWDGTSNPERSGFWSELWVIGYVPPWDEQIVFDWSADLGVGQKVTRLNYDDIVGLLATWKSAHSYIRAMIWTYDATLFNPLSSGTLPNGKWGQWSIDSGGSVAGFGSRVASPRPTTCRFWEFAQ